MPAPLPSSDHGPPLKWGTESLWGELEPLLPGLSVEVMAHADSTNTQLLQRFGSGGAALERGALPGRRVGDSQPCLLVAEHQSAGRGRMGRGWQSQAGASLTFSLATPLAPADWSGLSLAVGVALAEALEPGDADSPLIGLKWPNDLWFDERKLGGVLIETASVGTSRIAVIGVGLNVWPLDAPAMTSGHASVSEFDPRASAPGVLAKVAKPLVVALREFERAGFAAFRERFSARDVLCGRQVRSGAIEGTALGVSSTGGLEVETRSGVQRIISNEVSVRLAEWPDSTRSGL